jgi:eukaryotic-like serine/threonine-protein kinase
VKFTVREWQTLSKLFDEAMDLPEDARANWLESLDAAYASLQPALRHMLVRQAKAETDDFLNTLPKFDDVQFGNPTPSQLQGLTAGVAVGPYRLVRELGRGGMGAVWLAERIDGLIKRPVALKLPHPAHYNSQLGERFSRERDILAALVHPHIAKLYDAGVTESAQPYLALEYVEGLNITEYCDRESLPVRSRLGLFLQVLEAVQYAHTRLVIHRDIKPSNILITSERQAVLLDFGIAKFSVDGEAKETELTQLGGRAMTPDYASPEQIGGEPITTASDVYSLGIVLYELLTGERPYKLKRDSRGALEEAILAADPRAPSQVVSAQSKAQQRGSTTKKLANALKGDLDTIVLKALKKRPAERYATVNAFAQDLIHYLRDEPVLARPDSAWYRTKKFLYRNKLAAASSMVVLIALSVGLGVALWQANSAREQARIAKAEAQTAEAVQAFLQDIFRANTTAQSDPVKAQQTTARELLDIGERKIDRALTDAPLAKLKVLNTLADMYDDLELDERAAILNRKRVQLAKELYGPENPAVAEALIDLGNVTTRLTQSSNWQPAFAEAEKILDHVGDSSSRLRAKLELGLARGYRRTDLGKMREHAERSVRLLRAYPSSNELMAALYLKTQACSMQGDFPNSASAVSEALSVAKVLGNSANSLLPALYDNLGRAQSGLNDLTAADTSFRRALELARVNGGEDSDLFLSVQVDLGDYLLKYSHIGESITIFDAAARMALKREAAGDVTPIPSQTLFLYGGALVSYGRLEAGLQALRQSEDMVRKLGAPPDQTAPLSERRAAGLMEVGRYGEAEVLLTEAIDMRRKLGQEGTPLMNTNVALRTRLLLITGKSEQAAKTFDKFLVSSSENDTASRPQLERLVTGAELFLGAGDLQAAEKLAADALDRISRSASREYLRLWEARASHVRGRGYLLAQQAAKALPLLKQSVELDRQLYDPHLSPILAAAQIDLANCYLDLGQRDAAISPRDDAKQIHAAHPELGEHFKRPMRALEQRLSRLHTAAAAQQRER